MNQYEQSRENDIYALSAINAIGWLRAPELGQSMWRGNRTATIQAARLIRSMLARKLVIARPLPGRCGRAIMLATGGVRLLSETGIEAKSGKDLGSLKDGKWMPPGDWKHHLLTVGAMLRLGGSFIPEAKIKRMNPGLVKVPDAILLVKEDTYWVETEWSKKDGKPMDNLAIALARVANENAPTILGKKPTKVMVIYRNDAKDSRGYKVNHKAKLIKSVSAKAKKRVEVFWVECEVNLTMTVTSITVNHEFIDSNRAEQIRRKLESWKWHPTETGGFLSRYGDHIVQIVDDDIAGWLYKVGDGDWRGAENISEAKRSCAEAVAMLLPA